jgi:hypothetical protein
LKNKQKVHFKAPSKRLAIKCVILILLATTAIIIGFVSTTAYSNKNCPTNVPNVRFVAGSDSQISLTKYPAAAVIVAPNYRSATVIFSLFRSDQNSPQPVSCYTDLLRLKNFGAACTIGNITVSNIAGASNLGNITIYYYANQTDSPQKGTPIASVSLTNTSSGTITMLSHVYTLPAFATTYFEIVGYAAKTAPPNSIIRFTLNIQIGSVPPITHTVTGDGSLLMKHSAGTYSGDICSQSQFKFNVKSVDSAVSGQLSLTVRHTDSKRHVHFYQIVSYSPTALKVDKSSQVSIANFTMTPASIFDVTNPCRPTLVCCNANVQVSLTDFNGKQPDTIAFTVTSQSGQLYFSSNWICGHSVEQSLSYGTILIDS